MSVCAGRNRLGWVITPFNSFLACLGLCWVNTVKLLFRRVVVVGFDGGASHLG